MFKLFTRQSRINGAVIPIKFHSVICNVYPTMIFLDCVDTSNYITGIIKLMWGGKTKTERHDSYFKSDHKVIWGLSFLRKHISPPLILLLSQCLPAEGWLLIMMSRAPCQFCEFVVIIRVSRRACVQMSSFKYHQGKSLIWWVGSVARSHTRWCTLWQDMASAKLKAQDPNLSRWLC